MPVKIEVFGMKEAQKYLQEKEKNTNSAISKAMFRSATIMQGEVKASIAGHRAEPTSVDTGRFLNSVDLNIGEKESTIFTDLPYPPFLEWGTSHIPARHHFQHSADRNKEKVRQEFESEIKEI